MSPAPLILVAEDDPFFRETIQLNLEEHGAKVLLSKNGEEAIALLKSRKPNLLLLDLLMPKIDGFAVLSYMQEHEIQVPVIILSNLSEDIDHDKCFALGAKDYFVKSDMDESDLWPKVASFLPASLAHVA